MNGSAPNRRAFPLNILFVITAGCAILSALLTPLLRSLAGGSIGALEASFACVGGGLFGGFIGAIVGVYHYRRGRGLMWGLLVGLLIGCALGPLSLVPVKAAPSLIGLSIAGAMLLVAIAAAFRFSARE